MLRNLFSERKLVSRQYPVLGVSATGSPASLILEMTQYAQQDTFSRLLVRVVGNIVIAGAGPGAATGRDNPEGLLITATLQCQPSIFGVQPFNNVSARGIKYDSAFDRGYSITPTVVADSAGTTAVDYTYELIFKRQKVRNNIEWGLPVQPFTSVLLNLTFGGRAQLFTGGTNTWDLSGLNVEIHADSDFAVAPRQIHATEMFDNVYPVVTTQTDFAIDTLPPGYMYTDLLFIGEVSNALSNAVINNINLEGGGRVWLPQGDGNAPLIQQAYASRQFSVPAATQALTGLYPIAIRDGMYSRSIDALTAPITIRVNVTGGANNVVRLVGRRIIPGGIKKAQPAGNSAGA